MGVSVRIFIIEKEISNHLIVLFYQPVFLRADTICFDSVDNVIAKDRYEKIAFNRDKMLKNKWSDGYGTMPKNLKDPIKLREERIEKWRIMRSCYDPESLPSKIEKTSEQN